MVIAVRDAVAGDEPSYSAFYQSLLSFDLQLSQLASR